MSERMLDAHRCPAHVRLLLHLLVTFSFGCCHSRRIESIEELIAHREALHQERKQAYEEEELNAASKAFVSPSGDVFKGSKASEPNDLSNWGLRAMFMKDEAHVHIYHWPADSDPWQYRLPVSTSNSKPPSTGSALQSLSVKGDAVDKTLRLVHTISTSSTGSFQALCSAVNVSHAPLWWAAAPWVPASKHKSTRVQIVVSVGLRQLDEAQQCPLWLAVVDTIRNSPFAQSTVSLVSIAATYPYQVRHCKGIPSD